MPELTDSENRIVGRIRHIRHRRLLLGVVVVLVVLSVVGNLAHHGTSKAAASSTGPTSSPTIATVPAHPANVGPRTVTADTGDLGCSQILAPNTYQTGLAALTVKANNAERGRTYVWQFTGNEAKFTTGVTWDLVVYWLNGITVVGAAIAHPAETLLSPGVVTAAVAVPVVLVPYRQPTTIKIGGPCAA